MKQIIECVPNYSEGRDMSVIDSIVAAIGTVEGVKVLDVDPGEATNRTVVTFVGEPDAVCEAAFRGAKKAQELIDMRKHHGAHPRRRYLRLWRYCSGVCWNCAWNLRTKLLTSG